MAQENLKQKATQSMVWTAFSKYSNMIIQFVSGIILARLLTPHDYGCIGMLSIFMSLAENFIDGGFGSALIQKKNATQVDFSTIFFWNMGMAALLYGVLFLCAPAIARFYNIPLLCNVLRVQALVLFILAFNMVQRNQLRKKLNFKVLSIVNVSTSLIALFVTVLMAYSGFGVWALVVQNIIFAAIPALVFWFYIKWRPMWTFSWASFKELFGFGFYMFLTHLFNTFSSKLQGLLIGKVFSSSTMGYYSKAVGTESMASHSISSVMTQVTFPLYAKVQDDKAVLSNMIKRLTITTAYITFPLMFILLLIAKPMFVLLYSDRWLACVPYFQVLCVAGLAVCLQSINLQTISAIGKSKVMFSWSVIKSVIRIVLVVGGLVAFGMKGLLGAVVLTQWICLLINMSLVSKHVGYKLIEQVRNLMPIAVVAALAAGISYAIGFVLQLDMYLDGILKASVYVVIYMAWSWIFKPEAYRYTLTVIPEKFRFWERKSKYYK